MSTEQEWALVVFAMQHVPEPEEFVDALLADRDLLLSALGGTHAGGWCELHGLCESKNLVDSFRIDFPKADENSPVWVFPVQEAGER